MTGSRLHDVVPHALEWVEPADAPCTPDPWLFSVRSNFGCGGRARLRNLVYEDYPTPTVWQPDVYAEAARLAESIGAAQVIDFGCGSGEKLLHFFGAQGRRLYGVDFRGSLRLARVRSEPAVWYECNLALWSDLREVEGALQTSEPQLLIASDVIEHLSDPRPLVATIRSLLLRNPRSRAVISTPDRHRTRGEGQDGQPPNACHVREWLLPELAHALASAGLIPDRLAYTRSHPRDVHRSTAFIECRACQADYASYVQAIAFLEDSPHEHSVTVADEPEEWERVLQTVFLVPSVSRIVPPPGSHVEASLRAARSGGLLPHDVMINDHGVPFAAPRRPRVTVAIPVKNLRLDWLGECLEALRNQSLEPHEVVVVDLGSRADYRLALRAHLQEAGPFPVRLLRATGQSATGVGRLVSAQGLWPSGLTAWVPGVCLPLTDFLEVTARALEASPEFEVASTRTILEDGAAPLEEPQERATVHRWRAPSGMTPGELRLPTVGYVSRTDRSSRATEEPPLDARRAARLVLKRVVAPFRRLRGDPTRTGPSPRSGA